VLSVGEIARGTQGALKFLQFDRAAPLHFDNTVAACLRSFWLIALVAPLQVAVLMLQYSNTTCVADDVEVVLVESLRYLVDWLLFPVIFYEIARVRGWLDNYPRYISALNWMNLPGMVIALGVLVVAQIMPPAVSGVLQLGLDALILYWLTVTSRLALGVSWPVSILLTAINWLPSLLLSLIVERFLGIVAVGT
jgi:hypothetical protein